MSRHTPETLFAALDALGIAHATQHHPAVATVEAAKRVRGTLTGGHTKNLFLKDKKGNLVLLTALEDSEVRLNELHTRLRPAVPDAKRFSFARPEVMTHTLGVQPGAVTPLALINAPPGSLAVVFDARVLAVAPINVHPLVNTMTTALAPTELLRFVGHLGHRPWVLDLAGADAVATPL